jgi:penicillin amidase
MRKLLKYAGIVLLLVAMIGAAGGTWFVRRSWPQTSGSLDLAGITAPVEVIRDRWGIPQIYAQNERDLFFAQGYVHAQDRLWQMEFNRRIGYGTLSAVLGPSTVDLDRYVRLMGLRRAAEQELQSLDADSRTILEAYAAGVNAYIETHRDRLPLEFTILGVSPQPWQPLDTLMWGKVMSWTLSWNQPFELLRARLIAEKGADVAQQILPLYNDQAALAIPPEVDNFTWLLNGSADMRDPLTRLLGGSNYSQGSNSWVVHGSRTATGKPMLVDETHLDLGMPSIWYENGLHGGRFNGVGFSFPGVPLLIIGHNHRIAWGVTDLPADVQDMYIEKLNDPDNPTQYEFKGQWHNLQVVHETIEVKGAPAIEFDVRSTRHGPIINSVLRSIETSHPLTLKWTLYERSELFGAVVKLNLAGNWNEFREALRGWIAPNEHFIYADVEGNIGYQATGSVPVRSAKHQGLVPVPGWTGDYEWEGMLAYDDLPSVLNPPEGFIATANNKQVSAEYPHYLATEWSDPYRIRRITDLLAADRQITREDMQAIEGDTLSLPAQTLRQYLNAVKPENELQANTLNRIMSWDLRSETDSVGASIYHVWYWFLLQDTIGDELGDDLLDRYRHFAWIHMPIMVGLVNQGNSPWLDDVSTPQQETRDEIVQRSFVRAVAWLSERYGSDPSDWTWGKLHAMTFIHQPLGQSGIPPLEWIFNSRAIPVRGDDFTVNTAWSTWDNPDQPFAMFGGTAQRFIVDLSDFRNTLAVNATGQSGHAFHKHRADLIPLWQNNQFHPLPSSREDVMAQVEGVLTLRPASQ